MITFADIKIAARGRELELLRHFGLTDGNLTGKHQACPYCGGKDTYRAVVRAGKMPIGSFFCARANESGDWIDHVSHTQGLSNQEIFKAAADYLGLAEMSIEDKKRLERKRKIELRKEQVKSRIADANRHPDFEIKFLMDELHMMIEGRKDQLPTVDEENLASSLVMALANRYMTGNLERWRDFVDTEKQRLS